MGKLPVGGGSVREERRRRFVVSSSEWDASTCSETNVINTSDVRRNIIIR